MISKIWRIFLYPFTQISELYNGEISCCFDALISPGNFHVLHRRMWAQRETRKQVKNSIAFRSADISWSSSFNQTRALRDQVVSLIERAYFGLGVRDEMTSLPIMWIHYISYPRHYKSKHLQEVIIKNVKLVFQGSARTGRIYSHISCIHNIII